MYQLPQPTNQRNQIYRKHNQTKPNQTTHITDITNNPPLIREKIKSSLSPSPSSSAVASASASAHYTRPMSSSSLHTRIIILAIAACSFLSKSVDSFVASPVTHALSHLQARSFLALSTGARDHIAGGTCSSSSSSGNCLHGRRKITLNMVRNRGLEKRTDTATPQEGGMTLYVKAGPDGTSVGDCPFAHYVRMVLHEKNLDYDLKPSVQENKPSWLLEHYDGKMPALRHSKECYTESDVIANYLDFFFQDPPLSQQASKAVAQEAKDSVAGLFPAIAKYLKHTGTGTTDAQDGDDDREGDLKANVELILTRLNGHLSSETRTGPFMTGDGQTLTLIDCSLAPKLYHLTIGLKAFKNNEIDIPDLFPMVQQYMDTLFARDSFIEALYPEETIIWGWTNSRL